MRLLIVIVNYRTADLTIDCLRSLRDEVAGLGNARVVVADSASGDGSAERLRQAVESNGWTGWAEVKPLETNAGFAAGNNAVLRPALASGSPPDYALLLNPDTLVRPGAVGALVRFMDAHGDVGIAGSRLENPDGTPQRSAFRFPTLWSELESGLRCGPVSRLLERRVVAPPVPNLACKVDWVAGASMIVRRSVFDAVGLLDPAYFMYFEEVDFCRRAARAGWPCWYVPDSRVVHLVGQSSGVTDVTRRAARRRPAYWFESRRRFFLTHYGPVRTFAADALWAAGFAAWRLRRRISRAPDTDPARLLGDFVRHNFLGGSTPTAR